jgi:nucleoside-diphosphate-sugar epimerase
MTAPHRPVDTRGPERLALVMGATGAFGGHVAAALTRHGWRVRALAREPAAAAAKAGPGMPIDWVAGDAMDPASVVAAAQGAQLIVHAVNPPGYRNWAGTVLPMIDSTIAAARTTGARILMPGSVYNFAPDAGEAIDETTPQRPATRKGAIRVALEDRLRAASREGVRVLILRAGDFFGPGRANSAMDALAPRSGGRVMAVFRPGRSAVAHAFAYLPDLAETAARLLEREADLEAFACFHFAGHLLTVDALVDGVRRAAGRRLMVLPFPWGLIRILGRFDETLRELTEMRYLWRRTIGLDNRKLVAFLGQEPHTPLDSALREALDEPSTPAPPIDRREGRTTRARASPGRPDGSVALDAGVAVAVEGLVAEGGFRGAGAL